MGAKNARKSCGDILSEWVLIGDKNGENPGYPDVLLEGEVPDAAHFYSFVVSGNKYVCYGSYVGKAENPGKEVLDLYSVTDRDILYPVNRDAIFQFWPKSYICKRITWTDDAVFLSVFDVKRGSLFKKKTAPGTMKGSIIFDIFLFFSLPLLVSRGICYNMKSERSRK